MTLPLRCLLGYAAWTMLLILAIVTARGLEMLSGKKKMNEFPGGVQHGGPMYWRLYRAHANTVENLPIVAIIILVGTVMHVATPMFERLPQIALGARVVQSIVHVSSGSAAAVSVRFTAFATQYVCFGWMIAEILRTT
jgi:uncharacterized membrane protein YecN with MAPEG domain